MPNVSLDDLLERIPSKFNLVMVVAKRARQIKDGAPRMVATQSVNPVTAAMEEVIAGKLVLDGSVAHLVDDFGKPIRTAPDRLEELLGLSDDSSGSERPGVDSLSLDALNSSEDMILDGDSSAHESAIIPDSASTPLNGENAGNGLSEDGSSPIQ